MGGNAQQHKKTPIHCFGYTQMVFSGACEKLGQAWTDRQACGSTYLVCL
jgi:hypothetical protein